MLGEQGGNRRWGLSGDKEKKEDKEEIEGAKNIILFAAKTKKKQIDLGWNKLTYNRLKQTDAGWNKLT